MNWTKLLVLLLFIGCGHNNDSLKIKGSDTEVNLVVRLAENFHSVNPDFIVSISGGGSGLGIASLLNGQADIANASRALSGYEDSLFQVRNIPIKKFIFAEDAIAFIVHKSFPTDSLYVSDLAKILSGAYSSWEKIIPMSLPITIYGRQNNSGTYEFIKSKLHIEFSPHAKEMNGNAQIIESIKRDKSGIGYVGAGYIADTSLHHYIKVLKIAASPQEKAISPLDKKEIAHHHYYFQRPLYQFVRLSAWKKAIPFIEFEESEEGKKIIEASGYYTITDNKTQ